jgi:hypothetical protein
MTTKEAPSGGLFDLSTEEGSVLGRMNRIAGGYVLAKAAWTIGKSWHAKVKNAMTYRISVYGDDPIYDDLHAFILVNTPDKRQKSLVARSVIEEDNNKSEAPDSCEGKGGNSVKQPKRSRVVLSYKGEREQAVTIDGHRVTVSVDAPTLSGDPANWIRFTKQLERIVLTASSVDGRNAVHNMLREMLNKRTQQPHVSVVRITDRWGSWDTRHDLPARPMSTVVLRDGQAESLQDDLADFLLSEDEYNRRSIPWHRGYLFYGPPGTGKTSVAWALAHHFGLDLWYMPLADIEKDQDLIRLVSAVRPRSMLLLEDVDVFHAAKVRDDNNGVSLSGLLNSLDGVATPHGLITVMTTNDKSALDDALIRPGRIDRTEEIGMLDEDQASRLLQLFYPKLTQREARRAGRLCVDRSPAAVLEVCKRHLSDQGAALKGLSEVSAST